MSITAGSSAISNTIYSANSQGLKWRNYTWYRVDAMTATSVTVTLDCGIESVEWGMSINAGICGSLNFVKTADGSTVYSSPDTSSNYREVWCGFYSGSGETKAQNICESSITIQRTKVAQTWGLWTKVVNTSGYQNGEQTSAEELIVPALASYTVSYNANGGSGAPAKQTKWYGSSLTLSSTKPTRSYYTFQGWGTSSSATSVAYKSGATYSSNASVSLYAIWKANTYTVGYNANGGTGAPATQTKTADVALTLSSTKPTRANYTFLGWATSSGATSATYQPGASYKTNANLTLYAVWALAYTAPRITNISATRCSDSAGKTADDGGSYVKITFSWKTDKTISSIKVTCGSNSVTPSVSGTSGSCSVVVSGLSDSEATYKATILVKDTNGSSTSTFNVSGIHYIFDCSQAGDFAVGGPSGAMTAIARYATSGSADIFSPATKMYDPIQFRNVANGICGRGSSDTTWVWKRLCKTKNIRTAGWGAVRLTGYIGNVGVQGIPVDWYLFTKYGDSSRIQVYSSTNTLIAREYARIVVSQDSAGYISVWVAGKNWYLYNLTVQGDDITATPDEAATQTISDTILYNSGTPWDTNIGCKKYPQGFGPQFAESIYATYLSANAYEDSASNKHHKLILYWGDGYTDTGGIGGDVYKQLWSGSWSVGGTLTISQAYKYNMFLVQVNGFASLVPCYRNYNLQSGSTAADTFGGSASMPSATAAAIGDIWMSTVRISMAAGATTKLTLDRCCNFNLSGTTWNTKTVTKVFGVI